MTLNDALSDYYELRLARLAEATRDAHEGQLERWRTWVTKETQPNCYLDQIDDRLMTRYFNRLLPPGHEPSTYNSYRQYVNLFWKFCLGEGWVRTNPMRHVDALRVPTKNRLILSPDELLKMLEDAEPRDRVALALGMNTALRAGDLSRLAIGQVNLGNDTIATQISKSKKADLLPITADLRPELLNWFVTYGDMTDRPWQTLPNTWTLIPPMKSVAVNAHDAGLGRRVKLEPTRRLAHMERIVQRALAKLGHPTLGEGFHTLRRSALRAVHDLAAEDGAPVPIRIAQAMAGHASQQTTEKYLGITHEKRLRDEMLRGQGFLTRAVEIQQRKHDEGGGSVRAIG